jgi:predicted  nucleic acid-binding Zn-ribbon protein
MAISERNDLGAHVDLCAERYRTLEKKLDNLEDRMDKLEEHIIVIRTKLSETVSVSSSNNNGENSANKTIITIGTAFGVALLTGLITTIVHLALK